MSLAKKPFEFTVIVSLRLRNNI